LARITLSNVIAQISVLKSAAKYLAQVDRANDSVVFQAADEKTRTINPSTPLEEGVKFFRSSRR
jgi:hypothetical protein